MAVQPVFATYATLSDRPICVVGNPYNGWYAVDGNDSSANSQILNFAFSITDSGGGGFIFAYGSADQSGIYFNDTWHETLGEAFDAAHEMFGIERSEWQEPG